MGGRLLSNFSDLSFPSSSPVPFPFNAVRTAALCAFVSALYLMIDGRLKLSGGVSGAVEVLSHGMGKVHHSVPDHLPLD
jgi:hypothetical protein